LEQVELGLSGKLLEAVTNGAELHVQLNLAALKGSNKPEGADPLFVDEEDDKERIDDPVAQEHLRLYHAFERMSRDAELVKRETGRHALWLGYPLLYATAAENEILAPVFLWPVFVQIDLRRQGRVRIGRAVAQKATLPPRINRPMAEWIQRKFGFQLPDYNEADLAEFDLDAIDKELEKIANTFHPSLSKIDVHVPLVSLPAPKELDSRKSPRFFHSVVMGHFRWQNEAILADLDELNKKDECVGVAAGFVSGTELPRPEDTQTPPEGDRFLVHDADFSQERVIWQARTMPGLVVHGPPGTGKSQTIVNIIADALAHGRTVLMVCQKQAATQVVLKRLREVNLDNLCLEVHDAATDRQRVFKTIRDHVDQLKERQFRKQNPRDDLAHQIADKEKCLDDYARSYHGQHSQFGISYKHALAREGQIVIRFPSTRELRSLQKSLKDLSAQQIDEFKPRIHRVGQLFRLADPLNNPWRGRQPGLRLLPTMRSDLKIVLDELTSLDAEHLKQINNHGAGMPLPPNVEDFSSIAPALVKQLRQLQRLTHNRREIILKNLLPCWSRAITNSDNEELTRHQERCKAGMELAERVAKTAPGTGWDSICENRNFDELKRLRKEAQVALNHSRGWRSYFVRWYRVTRAVQTVKPAVKDNLWDAMEDLVGHLDALLLREQLRETNHDLVPGTKPEVGWDEDYQLQLPRLAFQSLEMACWLRMHEPFHNWIRPLIDLIFQDPTRLELVLNDIEQTILRTPFVQKQLKALDNLEPFLTDAALEEPRAKTRNGQSISNWVERLNIGLDKLEHLIALDADRRDRQGTLDQILHVLENYEVQLANGEKLPAAPDWLTAEWYGHWWFALVELTAVQMWIREFHIQHPVLDQVSPFVHEKLRQELRDLLNQKRAAEAETIREGWLDRQLQFRDRPWPRMFQQRSSRQHKAPRLREAVEMSLPEGLLAMFPCWLVNPEAAAQIFPLQSGLFDIVIFDEASQCPIEQAVPAIYRGSTLIVSGDEKQLPPTDFFAARADDPSVEDAETEEEDATDEPVETHERTLHKKFGVKFLLEVEDLLEAAIGNLPQYWLRVHYRSEHPDLIEFSNHAFYNRQLEAPPSRFSSQSDHRPIEYLQVDGLYSRRTNKQEAAKVIELLKGFWAQEATPTIGVVTFNRPQRDLIENLIEEECLRDESFAIRYEQERDRKDSNQDVGFFIKNLENVQGDERDLMIFSTTFGREGSGRFYRRFGPVGLTGGERRLNVAVTRAKKKVIVVTSMPLEEISDALKTGSVLEAGLKPRDFLQFYLAYSRAVSGGDIDRREQILNLLARQPVSQTLGGPESILEEEVLEVLEKWGFTVHPQVGESGFRIDLAVLHPDPARGYMLGIECDGATYHSDRSARIRDVWREKILRGRGWRLHRVWSTRWWNYRADEIEKLKKALSN
jgi:hypothetical protein